MRKCNAGWEITVTAAAAVAWSLPTLVVFQHPGIDQLTDQLRYRIIGGRETLVCCVLAEAPLRENGNQTRRSGAELRRFFFFRFLFSFGIQRP